MTVVTAIISSLPMLKISGERRMISEIEFECKKPVFGNSERNINVPKSIIPMVDKT